MAKKDREAPKADIKQIHGYLNDRHNKVVATVAWGDGDPKLNIRACWEDDDGELKLGKGVTLSSEEVDELTGILVSARNTGEIQKINQDGRKAINFAKVFAEGQDVLDKRADGHTMTKDGFVVLKKRPGVKLPYER